ncbi:MAG: zinc ribbon domain-containing protein [Proteobacteria bacterium]|nr:MAG: zinc ribbon domain-containing protein [Pseudomonadota bacterium]
MAETLDPPIESSALRFDCPKCGGQRSFDAGKGSLPCANCGYEESVAKAKQEKQGIVEYDLEDGLKNLPERGLGLETKSSACQSCGAIISFGTTDVAMSCSFCGSSNVLEINSHRQTLRPESLVPFQKTKAASEEQFKAWIKALWFRPNNLKQLAEISKIQGVYIPYWVFDARVDSDWRAMAGHHYYVTETYSANVNGRIEQRTRQVQKTRWVPAAGSRHDLYDDYLICASKGLPHELALRLETFDTRDLKAYDPSYIAGWRAEEYQLDLKPAWTQAVHDLEASQERRCGNDVPGDTYMGLQVQNRFSETRFKHILLPIWIAAYRYKGEVYQFLVNGQTGEVEGNAPYSYWKIGFFILFIAVLLLTALVFYGAASQQSSQY